MEISRRNVLAGTLAAIPEARAAASGPNILHIMTDQQQWATVAGRSPCRTPNLNRLAESGMLFERSYTPSAVCCPARAMILSGAYHWHNLVAAGVQRAEVDDMRARLYELMNRFGDPYGDLNGRGDRYCAPRYLPRGKRIVPG